MKRKLVHVNRARGISESKQRRGWDHTGGTVRTQWGPSVTCWLLDRPSGPLKPRSPQGGHISGGLRGQRGEMGSCKGGLQHSSCSGGQEPISPRGDRRCWRTLGIYTKDSRYLHWLIIAPPSPFPITVILRSCSPPAGSEMITKKKTLTINTIFSVHWQ